MRALIRVLRTASVITLFFFCWTYMPLYAAVAYAAEKQKTTVRSHESQVNGQGTGGSRRHQPAQRPVATTGDRFEKALEGIRENISKTEEKNSKGLNIATEITEIKARRAEIDALDIELKKEFAATEKKLKDTKLPMEILDRHHKFVKYYEDNLAELRANVAGIEQGPENEGFKDAPNKARTALEKVKPPKKHISLNPNKLPHRIVRAKKRAPRLKKEEFERNFRPQKKNIKIASWEATGNKSAQTAREFSHGSAQIDSDSDYRQIQLAYNEIVSDVPFSLRIKASAVPSSADTVSLLPAPLPDFRLSNFAPNSELSTLSYHLAQATADPPSRDDLAETVEIQFTQEIKDLASQLNYSAVKIYEWVRNNIEFVPTYGSIQGAGTCLQTKQCNDFDTASLLISLLRTSGISSRYVYGTIEIPIDKVKNWVGGFSDPTAALTLIASGGVPVAPGMTGSVITKVQLEHIWVEANLAYGPYSGRPSNLSPDNIWVPLDPSFKQYSYTHGIDLQNVISFDEQAFADQIQATATTNEAEGYVTNLDSNYIQSTMTDYQIQVQNYISQNIQNATIADVIGKKEIKMQELSILPVSLPYTVITVGMKFSELPDSLRHKITFEIQGSTTGNSISYTARLPEIAGKRVTLSYFSATLSDEQAINDFGGLFNVPAYLVNMKPQIKIEGVSTAIGTSIGLGNQETFNIKFESPSGVADSVVSNKITVGAYYGIGINPSKITADVINKRRAKLEAVKSTVNDVTILTDDYIGELIYTTAMAYFFELNSFTDSIAKKFKIIDITHVSEAIVSKDVNVITAWAVPISIQDSSMMIDVDRLVHSAISESGNLDEERKFTILAGQMSSALEYGIFEQMYRVKGVSTAQVLQFANSQGIPIYTVTPNNIYSVLPLLQISAEVKADIQNVVGSGKNVIIPQRTITYYGWTGTGYIVMDPITGSGAYMISTSLIGGGLSAASFTIIDIVHGYEVPLSFLATAVTGLNLSYYIALEVLPLAGVAGTLLAIMSSVLLIASIFVAFWAISALIDLYSNHAYNDFYPRRIHAGTNNIQNS